MAGYTVGRVGGPRPSLSKTAEGVTLGTVRFENIAKRRTRYPLALQRCEERYDPAPLAQYFLDLAKSFNKFYHETRILDAAQAHERRLTLVVTTVRVFESAFEIIEIPMLQQV